MHSREDGTKNIMTYDYWLTSIKEISNKKKTALVEYFGNAKALFNANEKALLKTGLLDLKKIDILINKKSMYDKDIVEKLTEKKIGFVSRYDSLYPKELINIYDSPYGIFYKGDIRQSFSRGVAIVGARKCSAYGSVSARDISKMLASRGALIISGMAKGVDGAAHSGALLSNMPSVAVLGCGVDICYPWDNKYLYQSMIENGCIISEVVPGTNPAPYLFPLRNRIISGLSKVIIVVEAAKKSGSLITADIALDQGKDVYALPGRINDRLSLGSNKLIYQGASIIYDLDSLLEEMESNKILSESSKDINLNEQLNGLLKEEKEIMSLIDYSPKGIDELMEKSGLDMNELLEILSSMLEKGLIKQEGKNRYVKNYI